MSSGRTTGPTDRRSNADGSCGTAHMGHRGQPRALSERATAEARVAGPCDGLGAVGDVQLAEHVRDVVAHGLVTHDETPRDRRVREAAGDEVEDLPLAVGE